MTIREPTASLSVEGTRVAFESANTLHGVANPIGQLTVTFRTPLPTALTSGTGPVGKRLVLTMTQVSHDGLNTAGVRQNLTQESSVVFTGTLRRRLWTSDTSGRTETYQCSGDLRLFANGIVDDRSWNGPIDATAQIRGMLQVKGYGTGRRPALFLDSLRFPDGTAFTLGGNNLVDNGDVVLKEGGNELALMGNIAECCGFSLYETPPGNPRLSRTMGVPPSVGATDLFRADGGYRVVSSADDGFTWRGEEDGDEPINYWEVFGARWSAADGTDVEIRSFPDVAATITPEVPSDEGFRREQYSSPFLLTQKQADGARNIREQDRGGRVRVVTVEVDGMPTCYPGHVHKLVVPDKGINETYWVMTVAHTIDSRGGYRTTITYRRGGGSALPAGVDVCTFRSLWTTARHIGDEYVAWYVVPSATGSETISPTFTPSVETTSMAFVARAHGCNSQWTTKPPPDGLTGTKVVVEQLDPGDSTWKSVGDNSLPVLDEKYAEALPYSNDAYWTNVQVNIPGTLVAGRLTRVKVVAGSDGVGLDDCEIKNAQLMTCVEGLPALPGTPRPSNPTPPQQPGSTAPGGGVGGRPTQSAAARLLTDGTATPSTPARPTNGPIIPKGTKTIRLVATFTNLTAGSGTLGAGFAEYFRLSIRNISVGGFLNVNQKMLNGSGVVQSGSGERSASFDVTAFCASSDAILVTRGGATNIRSETNTITISNWDAQLYR